MNDALLSNSLQFASGGVGPLITIWARTRGNLDVKAVAALDSMPLYLNTRNPNIKTIKDFGPNDRIAVPTVKTIFKTSDYATGETTLARDMWNEVPENSVVIFDRAFLVKKDLVDLETSGNRHWISRTKSNTKWAIREKLGLLRVRMGSLSLCVAPATCGTILSCLTGPLFV